MKKLREKLREKLKKKGVTSIEAVIGTMIFLFLFCATCDLIMLSNRYASLTDVGKELARTISVQGGALSTKPGGYASNYYTITNLEQLVDKNMKAAGFEDGNYVCKIQYSRVYDDAISQSKEYTGSQKIIYYENGVLKAQPTLKIDYLSDFSVEIIARYKWKFMSSFIPDRVTLLKVTMPGLSEWKYNYDAWESEQ